MSDLKTNRMLINGIISGPCVCKQQVFQDNLKQNIIYRPKRVVYDCLLYGEMVQEVHFILCIMFRLICFLYMHISIFVH